MRREGDCVNNARYHCVITASKTDQRQQCQAKSARRQCQATSARRQCQATRARRQCQATSARRQCRATDHRKQYLATNELVWWAVATLGVLWSWLIRLQPKLSSSRGSRKTEKREMARDCICVFHAELEIRLNYYVGSRKSSHDSEIVSPTQDVNAWLRRAKPIKENNVRQQVLEQCQALDHRKSCLVISTWSLCAGAKWQCCDVPFFYAVNI